MKNIETAKNLLEWNKKNLNAKAIWQAEELSEFFSSSFIVLANGRRYEANYQTFADFLNTMRANLSSMQYQFHEYITTENTIVIPLTATLTQTNESIEKFEAILILKFDETHKITVWQEVYVKL